MAEIDDIRAHVQAHTGVDPDTETATCKDKAKGIYSAGPDKTYVRTPDGGAWCCLYRNIDGVWEQEPSARLEPGDEYAYGEETRIVPDWKAVL